MSAIHVVPLDNIDWLVTMYNNYVDVAFLSGCVAYQQLYWAHQPTTLSANFIQKWGMVV